MPGGHAWGCLQGTPPQVDTLRYGHLTGMHSSLDNSFH